MAIYYPNCRAVLQVVFDGFGGTDSNPTIVQVRPKTASVHLNGYKEADTWELTFDAKLLPFSPELVRAVGAEIYMFATDGLSADPENYAIDKNLVVAGLADNAAFTYSNTGGEFRLDGRDYTALLIDKQWPPEKRVPVGRPLDETVQALVNDAITRETFDKASGKSTKVAPARTLTVTFDGGDAPTVGQTSALTTHGKLHVSKKGKVSVPTTKGPGKTSKKGVPAKAGNTYWDVIYRLCITHGYIVYVDGLEVKISTPNFLYDSAADRIRKVFYGRNLSDLHVERHLGRETVPQIRISSYDGKGKQIVALYPERVHDRVTGIGTKKEEIRDLPGYGVSDLGTLKQMAKNYYENLARSEAKIRFSTKDLTDLDGNDLLHMRPGDPVAIGFDAFNDEQMRQLDVGQRISRLEALGYSEAVSQLVASEFDRINQFRQPFYTKEVNVEWDKDNGLSLDVEAINYVSVKRDDAAQ